jgi:hypothetical protein
MEVQECDLNDLGFCGLKFTWKGQEMSSFGRVFQRLDKGFGNIQWHLKFQNAFIKVMPRVKCDHHPILVVLGGDG